MGPTPAAARERARTVLGRNYEDHQHPNRVGTIQMASTKLDPSMPDEAVTVDYLMDNVWIVGDPAECAEKIHQLHEESGGFGSLLSITTDSDDAGWDHESLRLLMEQVAPRVAHLGVSRNTAGSSVTPCAAESSSPEARPGRRSAAGKPSLSGWRKPWLASENECHSTSRPLAMKLCQSGAWMAGVAM